MTTQVPSSMLADGVFTTNAVTATTSGTEKIITGIPAWAKRVTIVFQQVSLSGTANLLIQAGTSSGATTSGYAGGAAQAGASPGNATSTVGLQLSSSSTAASTHTGIATFTLLDAASNTWVGSSNSTRSDGYGQVGNTVIALAAALDRIRFTTTNGTDTFDNGSINVLYE